MGMGGGVQYSSFRRGDREGQEGQEEGQQVQRADKEPDDWR